MSRKGGGVIPFFPSASQLLKSRWMSRTFGKIAPETRSTPEVQEAEKGLQNERTAAVMPTAGTQEGKGMMKGG